MKAKDLNAQKIPDVYASIGINVNKLGCIMLDTHRIKVTDMVLDGQHDLYEAADPEHYWIRGAVAEHGAHVTLLYGLLASGLTWKAQIDAVLDGWSIDSVTIEDIGIFESPIESEPYDCVIAHIKLTPNLLEGHARLELLPHINTFLEYRPHISLAYVKKGEGAKWVKALTESLVGRQIAVTKLNYGSKHD